MLQLLSIVLSASWALYVNTLGLPNPLGGCIGYAGRRSGLIQRHEAGNRIAEGHKVHSVKRFVFSPSYMSDTREAVVLFGSNDFKRKSSRALKGKILGIYKPCVSRSH